MWTFVIAGGGVYVMTLNGSLMPLTGTALVLLGVTGATAVLSSAAENRGGARPSSIRPPGALQKVVANAVPESSDLIVQWTPSETGGPVSLYNVSWTQVVVGAQKPDAGSIVTRDNIVRLTRLVSKADYIVSVNATNPGGPSQAVASEKTTTNDGGGDFSDIPGQYSNNADDKLEVAEDKTSNTTIMLQRMPKDGTMLQYRRLDSEDLWTSVMYPQTSGEARLYSVSGLLSGVDYEFRVKVDDNGKWSKPITGLTRHTPQWADIVSEPERPTEIELTRVQMLIFTVSTAIFVSFKVADGGAIPDIPNEYIWLMGISNGVYLGNKWAR